MNNPQQKTAQYNTPNQNAQNTQNNQNASGKQGQPSQAIRQDAPTANNRQGGMKGEPVSQDTRREREEEDRPRADKKN